MPASKNPSSKRVKRVKRTNSPLATPGSNQNVVFGPTHQSDSQPQPLWPHTQSTPVAPFQPGSAPAQPASPYYQPFPPQIQPGWTPSQPTTPQTQPSRPLAYADGTSSTPTAAFSHEMNLGRAEIPPGQRPPRGNSNFMQHQAARANTSPPSALSPHIVPAHLRQPPARQRSPAGRRGRPSPWSFGTNPTVSLDPATMDDEPDAEAVAQIKSIIPVIPRQMNGEADVGKMIDRLAKNSATTRGRANSSGRKTKRVNSSHSRNGGFEMATRSEVADADSAQSREVEDGAGADFDAIFNTICGEGYTE
ncbi:hypothetical protein B0A52_04961 [Exophiala mesophila]|uniref:Uncharacterized protein n=1 Tax=Exophiala mesophila TaxID=212818 RepID=A0A438N6L0_EXOME|nr:hypothetical protein B0A52_04961 [Exophiala mesophila]